MTELEELRAKLARTQQVLTDLIAERSPANVAPGLLRDIARWVEHAPKLKDFLDGAFTYEDADYYDRNACSFCHERGNKHALDCQLLELWRAINPERYQKTIDEMFAQWCEQEQRRQEREWQRCTCAGGSPRAREIYDHLPHDGTCPLSRPQGLAAVAEAPGELFQIVASPNVPQGTQYDSRDGVQWGSGPVARMQNVQRAINLGYITEEQARRLLTTDQTLPETQGAHVTRHRERQARILGVDFGSNDGSAIAIGHIEPDGRLVVDEIEYAQPTPERDNE